MEATGRIIWLDETDSTNYEVRRRISELANLSVVAAIRQTAGRGQGDHTWTSAPGENLTFTLLLTFPPCAPVGSDEILRITEVVTYALRRYLLGKGVETRIKWPNDIYVGEKKICGILIENILQGKQVSASIIGIGLNLNQTHFPADIPNPVSLRELTGQVYDIRKELCRLHAALKKSAALLDTQEGRMLLDKDFHSVLFRREG